MERSSLHSWLYIGEVYFKYRKDRALALYQQKDIFRAVKDMSLRQFISFSRGKEPGEAVEVLYTTRLYDMEELRRFERVAERLKRELRVNYKEDK
jgi:hypothetical protein